MRRGSESLDTTIKMLVHGGYGCGKTYLAGQVLKSALDKGSVGVYASITSEPVHETLATVGFPTDSLVTLDTYADVDELLKLIHGEKSQVLAIDSLQNLMELCVVKVTGGQRTPGTGGKDGRAEWGQIKFLFNRAVNCLLAAVPTVVALCASTKKDNELNGETLIYPALFGDTAQRIAGFFPFVGYMDVVTMSASKVQRRIHFQPSSTILTRCNVKHAFPGPYDLVNGWPGLEGELAKRRA